MQRPFLCPSALPALACLALAVCSPLWPQSRFGPISTLAGAGQAGSSGDGGKATLAQVDMVYAVAADPQGNLFIADSWSHRVRKVTTSGDISTIAGTGEAGFSGDGGPAISAKLFCPRGLALDAHGNLYIADSGNSRVRKVLASSGAISTIAGTGKEGFGGDAGQAAAAQLNRPRGLALDADGNLYIADSWNFRVRKVTPQGAISTVAGSGTYGVGGDGGAATVAALGLIQDLAVGPQNEIFFSDVYNHIVRKISPDGRISTVIGGGFGTAIEGTPAQNAPLKFPRGIAVDSQGTLFVADSGNHRIVTVLNGDLKTVAGAGVAGFSGEGGAPLEARLNAPYDVLLDAQGSLVVADTRNYRVRIAPDVRPAVVSTASVQNAATYLAPGAPGMLATIWGRNFGSDQLHAAAIPLPTQLGATSVLVDNQRAPLLHVAPNQINFQLPTRLSAGKHALKVAALGMESDPIDFQVVDSAPGVFAFNGQRGVVINLENGALNLPENAASRDSWVMTYGTGQGQVDPLVEAGEAAVASPLSQTPAFPDVLIGGERAQVGFSGLAPGFVGLWQLNVKVPSSAPVGDSVPLVVSLGGRAGNTVMMSVK